MTNAFALPAGFAPLEPFVSYWAAATLSERDTRRLDSTEIQRKAFYDVGKELAPKAIEYLDAKPFESFDDADHRLMNLMLSLIHATLAVEVQRDGEPAHARGARRMPIVRERASPRDLANEQLA